MATGLDSSSCLGARAAGGPTNIKEELPMLEVWDLWLPDDLGRLVILPGGEAGILKAWWHANDHSQWRWQVEFSNHT